MHTLIGFFPLDSDGGGGGGSSKKWWNELCQLPEKLKLIIIIIERRTSSVCVCDVFYGDVVPTDRFFFPFGCRMYRVTGAWSSSTRSRPECSSISSTARAPSDYTATVHYRGDSNLLAHHSESRVISIWRNFFIATGWRWDAAAVAAASLSARWILTGRTLKTPVSALTPRLCNEIE